MKNRLRVLRAEFHISQGDLAERVGVARQTIHAVENGKFAPSLTLGFKIASLFGADINEVFAPDPDDTVPSLLETQHDTTSIRDAAGDSAVHARPLIFFGRSRTGG